MLVTDCPNRDIRENESTFVLGFDVQNYSKV